MSDNMRQTDLIPFFFITFAVAWGILGLYIFAPDTMVRLFGNLTGRHPLFYMAVYAPAIAALAVIVYRQGVGSIPRFLSRLLLWRASILGDGLMGPVLPPGFHLSAPF